jgi:hypothetical protein
MTAKECGGYLQVNGRQEFPTKEEGNLPSMQKVVVIACQIIMDNACCRGGGDYCLQKVVDILTISCWILPGRVSNY